MELISYNLFRFFIRKTYKKVNLDNKICDELNDKFSAYLENKLNGEQLKNVLPKDEIEVIMNQDHPLKKNGFHPAFLLHFLNFVDQEKNKLKE